MPAGTRLQDGAIRYARFVEDSVVSYALVRVLKRLDDGQFVVCAPASEPARDGDFRVTA